MDEGGLSFDQFYIQYKKNKMRQQDLRIGNLVFIPQYNKNATICHIEQSGRFCIDNYKSSFSSIECARPIPLTEQWLLDLGFKKIEATDVFDNFNYPYWVKNCVILLFNSSPPENTYKLGYAEMRSGKYYAVTCRWINDVHTLQNAYASFTGEELTLKENKS